MEYRAKLLRDCFNFMKLVGGAIELCDRGWKTSIAMDENYINAIEDYCIKWVPDETEKLLPIMDTDTCLQAEHILEEFFKQELATMLDIGWDSYEQM